MKTLSRRADFVAANKGRRRVTPGFILITHQREGDAEPRVGFTVTKKIGNAVVRNRMKRRFRALARDVIAPVAHPYRDYILIGRAGGIERDYGLLKAELVAALTPPTRGRGDSPKASGGGNDAPPTPTPPINGRGF